MFWESPARRSESPRARRRAAARGRCRANRSAAAARAPPVRCPLISLPISCAYCVAKRYASSGMSSFRSRSGGKPDRDDAQSIVEVLPETDPAAASAARSRFVVATMRTSTLIGRRSADALELLLLQHAQQLRLQVEPHLGDFVEQQRAAVRALERALDALDRAGERALLVAEQRALDEAFGQRRAIQLDERAVAPVALRRGSRARTAPCRCPIRPRAGPSRASAPPSPRSAGRDESARCRR